MSDGGKGSAQRPGQGYADNYDRIFGQKKTGWPEGMLQDDSSGLSRWLAGKPDAREVVRRNIAEDNGNGPD